MTFALVGLDAPLWAILTGALTGLTYALLAIGLILVYRGTGVINLSQGAMGGLGALVLAKLVIDYDWNYFAALVVVLIGGAVVGATVELCVIRRLFEAPRAILLVATIGVAQVMLGLQLAVPEIKTIERFPSPLPRTAEFGGFLFRSEHFMVLAVVPALVLSLTYFMNRTPFGLAIRASAQNAEAAELAGISVRRVDTVVRAIAGALATLTVVLAMPLRGGVGQGATIELLGPGLLLRALTVALVARFVSLPIAVAGGVALGIVEAVLLVNVDSSTIDPALVVLVLVLVLIGGHAQHEADRGWGTLARRYLAPADVGHVWWVRHAPRLAAALAAAIAVGLPLAFDRSSQVFLFSRVLLLAMVGIALSILIGWAGQLSLGQFAFYGLGAMVAAAVFTEGAGFPVAVLVSVAVGVGLSLVVGFPAVRGRGLFLVVTTLAFAVMASGWLFNQTFLLRDGRNAYLPRGKVLGFDLQPQRNYYYVCLGAIVVAAVAVGRLRRSGRGRCMIAVRDNPEAAASFGVSPTLARLAAFGLAGALTALAGSLFAGLQVRFGPEAFPPGESLQLVAMAVIGGLGSVSGAIIGAVYVVGLPAMFGHNDTIGLMTSGFGVLVLLLYFPGGLIQLADAAWRGLAAIARRRGHARPPEARTRPVTVPAAPRAALPRAATTATRLRTSGVSVHFGGLQALRDVSIDVRAGEMVGLIGANGAGKSTLMNVIGGFVGHQAGTIELDGQDITRLAPHRRCRLGLGRVFQDARLFETLTVLEIVQVAVEAREPSRLVPCLVGTPRSSRRERQVTAIANDTIDFLGLGGYAHRQGGQLSTGTRRVVELACLVAERASVLLLDEPTAGLAQRETEAFGPLIRTVQAELGAAALLIEHDMPLVMGIADRVYCFDLGQVIAEGTPAEVRHDPKVIAAYLGTDDRAIDRSGDRSLSTTPI